MFAPALAAITTTWRRTLLVDAVGLFARPLRRRGRPASPAAPAAQIGGDLYAVLDTPYGVRALVGDVRGKGLDAVQTSAVALGSFREAAYDEGGLMRVAEWVDASVSRHVDSELTGEFTTALFAQFREPGEVELLHWPGVVLVLCTDGVIEARGPAGGEFYPLAERAGALLVGAADDLEAAVEKLCADLVGHAGGALPDDAVLLLLARGNF
ncbi:serine/threonine-protein phosphatase [Streptomyces sp. NBC_01537]|uniref:PP2C family protein-serine/threonine phosphatase n=1 Tax=Streptomyces sp. NBC_01537 TaxID=2903896 RepID=UPI0038684E35